ncbi:hypothetical protein NKG05_26975 [Oerskovia sp. M15]
MSSGPSIPTSRETTALLHDGSTLTVEITGTGPAVLLPVNPVPATGAPLTSSGSGASTLPSVGP